MKRNLFLKFSVILVGLLFICIEIALRTNVFAQSNPVAIGQPASLEGHLVATVADNFENQKAYYDYYIQAADVTLYKLENLKALPQGISSGDYVKVDGSLVSDSPYVSTILEPKLTLIKKSEKPELSSALQNVRVAVILVNFRNDTHRPWDRQQIYDKYFSETQKSVKTFYRENSYGRVEFTGDVFDNQGQYYTLDMDTPGCGSTEEILSRAIQATDPDIVFRDSTGPLYDEIVVAYPKRNCADWIGIYGSQRDILTNEGTINVGINWINGYAHHLLVVAHELGHSLGLAHANSYHCPSGRYQGEGCHDLEYGNIYDTMGANWGIGDSQTGHFNSTAKDYLGWFRSSNKIQVTDDDTFYLAPIESVSFDVQTLFVGSYQIEYRKSTGFDSFLPASGLHIVRRGSFGGSQLIDLHSVSTRFFLKAGEEFYDPDTGIYIQALSESAYGMEVYIQLTRNPNLTNLIVFQEDEWPADIGLGQTADLFYYTFNNSSRDAARPFREGLYVKSPDSSTWNQIQTREVLSLPAGRRQHDSFSWTTPTNICGAFKAKVVTDDKDKVVELSETDNSTPSDNGQSINVVCPGSDLTVNTHNWPDRFNMGDNVSFGFSTTNQGTVDTGAFSGRYYIDDQQVGGRYVGNLGPGQSSTTGFSLRAACGVHEVEVKTDADNQIPETNELNNTTGLNKFWNNPTVLCGPENPISARSAEEWVPSISGSRIVWQDNRNGNWDIYLFDLNTKIERQITNDPASQTEPSISGNIIVWTDERNGNKDVYMMDLATNVTRPIASNTFNEYSPAVSARRVVWVGDLSLERWQVYSYDFVSGQTRRITLLNVVSEKTGPRTWGDYIAWRQVEGNLASIYFYSFLTDRVGWLTGGPLSMGNPDVSDNKVVWSASGVIFARDLILNLTQRIGNLHVSFNPKIFGKNVVWNTNSELDNSIYQYDFTTGQTRKLTVSGSIWISGAYPSISGNYVVWEDKRGGDRDSNIYMHDLTPIKITSPANGSGGGANVTITYEMNQGGVIKFYDNDRLINTTGNNRGIYQYTFTNLAYGKHMLKVKIENNINPGEDVIRCIVKERIERKPVISKRTLKPAPAKASVSSKKK